MKYNKIKNIFLKFFKKKKHKIFKSSSIINKNKKNIKLMFINSGINQFLDYFSKKKKKYNKIANIQKCIRITGKNNDLNMVGYDNLHHTMFEMMGNWSFGSYSQEKAIKLAWELITKKYKISKKKIYVTIFKGDKKNNLDFDYKSYNTWKKLINKNNILFFGIKHNFWKIDNFNFCGPSTEIHIDIRKYNKKNILGKLLVNKNNNSIIELWNIVNIKYLIKNNIIYKNKNLLSDKYIDTGMGFERLCMIIQNKQSTYETDIFLPIIKKIEKILYIKYGINNKTDIVIKIISDHIRSIFFSILDGIKPNNKKNGYIIRKLIRRSLIYSYKYLFIKKPFLYKILPTLFKLYYNNYYYDNNKYYFLLKKNIKILKNEENKFFLFLKKNYLIVKKILLKKNKKKKIKIDKKIIYNIFDTYGIYYFLIKKICLKYNIKIINFNKINNKIIEL
ncbi:MAG: alanine--tRNA ligase-related protein [Candidatus Shikimatogenerans bostrichidophilus]|nr:MAG: alanine--tRNA ligase-related protein [Candidatus Shikimatogenerans bostrichidophilus]